jgi:hypothetical protein
MKRIILSIVCLLCCLIVAAPKATGQVNDENLQKVLLYLPGDDLRQGQQLTVTLSNPLETPVDADITVYDEVGFLLTNIPVIIEAKKSIVMNENDFPVMARLLVVESEYEVKGYIILKEKGGKVQYIEGFRHGRSDFLISLPPEEINNTSMVAINPNSAAVDLIIVKGEQESALCLAPMESRIIHLNEVMENQSTEYVILKVSSANDLCLLKVLRLSETAISGNERVTANFEDASISMLSTLNSVDPLPGGHVHIPFLCGGSDTLNRTYCIDYTGDSIVDYYLDGWIHPGLDLSKSGSGSNRNNRVVATLPGNVVNVTSTVSCESCPSGGYGNKVILRHLLNDGNVVYSACAHLLYVNGQQPAGLTVSETSQVVGGQFLGYKGNTGNSYGAHLHFETGRNQLEGGYSVCQAHWRPVCQNGSRTTAASYSVTVQNPALFRNGQKTALLPYFSSTATIPNSSNYEVYCIADRALNASLTLTSPPPATLRVGGRDEIGTIIDIQLPDVVDSNGQYIRSGNRTLQCDWDGTDYRFFAYSDSTGGGYRIKLTSLPSANSKIIDNDSLSGFSYDYRGTDGNGIYDKVPGYYISALAYEAHSGQYAQWRPSLNSGTYGIWVHVPFFPYGTIASSVRYKIFPTVQSGQMILSDPVNHGANQNQWVRLTSNNGNVQEYNFNSDGYIGLSIDQTGGNNNIVQGNLVGVDAVKFIYINNNGSLPSAPSNLIASALSSSQINLSWNDNSTNETGFKIERKTGATGTWAEITTVGANVRTYSNTGLNSSTTYYYRVRAYNGSGNSGYSNEAYATTSGSGGNCMSSISVGQTVNGNYESTCTSAHRGNSYAKYYTFTLSDTRTVTIDLTSAIDTYLFLLSGSGSGGSVIASNDDYNGSSNSHIQTTLNAGTYTIEATTYTSGQTGSFSLSLQSPASAPPAPSNLSTSAVSSSQINLSWNDNSTNETGFKIERKTGSSGTWAEITTVGANVRTYSNTGLNSSTTYYYRVRAYNGSGNSGYSNEAYATTSGGGGNCMSSISVGQTVNGNYESTCTSAHRGNSYAKYYTFTLSDTRTVTIDLTSAIDTYLFLLSGSGSGGSVIASNDDYNGSSNSHIQTTLNAGTYTIEATTYTSGQTGSFSLSLQSTAGSAPTAPSNLIATAVSSSQINLSWNDNSTNETGFRIERKTVASSAWAEIPAGGANVRTYSDTGLNSNTTYYYRVRAYNGSGNSGYSNEAYATTNSTVVTYTSYPSPGTYTTGGNVLKVKVTFNGSRVTFTVAKQDNTAFTSSGIMTIRAGAYNGCVANYNTYYWNYSAGYTTTSATFDLYFTSGSKDLYAAIGLPNVYCDGTPPTYYSGKLTIQAITQ